MTGQGPDPVSAGPTISASACRTSSDGREETQRLHLNPHSLRWLPDHSHLQRHVNIAVAYNVWQHYMVTGSIEFLRFSGAEMLIEIARF